MNRPYEGQIKADPAPEGYISKDIISYPYKLYPKVAKKGYFLLLFGAGYFGDIIS
jgi:hypothetical protein